MWKTLLLLAFVASFDMAISCDDDNKCGPNERYVACPDTMCIPQNCSQRGLPLPCPVLGPEGKCPSKPACICVENYLRDDTTGECIPSKKCKPPTTTTTSTTESPHCGCGGHPPKCGKYEVYNNCSNSNPICQPTKCSELGFPLKCDKKCKPGCVCKDDYVRDDNGDCIPKKNCPKCGNDCNATPGCGVNCGKTCATYKMEKPFCPLFCKPNGCDCKDGYVYDPNLGACVRPKDCTPTCKVNEEYSPCSNGGCGHKYCSQIGQPNICNDPVTCIKGCVCVKGYLRDADGTCVPTEKCPPKCTGPNEYWEPCIQGCSNQTCGSINQTYHCPNQKGCKSGCRCKPGFYRNADNICISENECPKTCGKNEHWTTCYYSCGGSESCEDIGKKYSCPAQQKCLSGCRCDKGYWRNKDQECIPECECPHNCPPGEMYEPCPTVPCDGDWCPKTRDSPQTCPVGIVCDKPRCVCGPNSKRDWASGKCVHIPDCPPFKCDCNEEYVACSSSCPGDSCAAIVNKPTCPKIGISANCRPKCICSKGYCRNSDGKCVPVKKPPTCKVNEEYSPCINGGCDRKNCSQVDQPAVCIDPVTCIEGCVCVKGYLRAADGTCVPIDKCPRNPPKCCKNEVYNNCSDSYPICQPTTCSELGFPLKCDKKCKPGCVCKDDYVRDDNGDCIPKKNCPKCGNDRNATSGCGVNCGKTCATYKIDKPICLLACKLNGCDCKDGYVYNPAVNACVLPKDCPPDCPPGERHDTCPTVPCDGDWCPKTRDSPQTCPVGIVCDKPRCVCGYNMKRDWISGKCKPITECTPFKCDCNEEYVACSSSCPGDSCAARLNKPICPKIGIIANCRPKCICSKGYCRNSDGKCVPDCKCHGDSPVEKP